MKKVVLVAPHRLEYLSPYVVYAIDALPTTPDAPDETTARVHHLLDLLTPRQREVMELYAHGVPRKAIAELLGIAPFSVRHHRERALKTMRAGMRPYVGGRPLAPCGTSSAYVRHRRHGETPCEPCRLAHSAERRRYKQRAKRGLATT